MATYIEKCGGVAGRLPCPPPKPSLQIPEVYLDFFSKTSDFAIPLQEERYQLSVASGADDKVKVSQWIYQQVMDGVRNPA